MMKKTFILLMGTIIANANAQSWNISGNSGTSGSSNFMGTTDNQDLVFKTNNTERIKISSNGNIGIGTNPDSNIALKSIGRSQFISNVDKDAFQIRNIGSNISNGTSLAWLSYQQYQPNNPGAFDITGITSPTGTFENIMSVKTNGKVVLGPSSLTFTCSDCSDYRLFVKNGIRTEKVKVDIAAANGWADYVFEQDYKLMPLNELEKFINTNKHLPEVPTTKEAIENGVELKEMNILLLKKVEELTLYVIKQGKEIEELKNKIDSKYEN